MTGLIVNPSICEHAIIVDLGSGYKSLISLDGVERIDQFPWPIPDGACQHMIIHNLFDHIAQQDALTVINECWRILEDDGQVCLINIEKDCISCGSLPWRRFRQLSRRWPDDLDKSFDGHEPAWEIFRPKSWQLGRDDLDMCEDTTVLIKHLGPYEIYHTFQSIEAHGVQLR